MESIYMIYSRTSKQRTLWDCSLCPLFRGCPLFIFNPWLELCLL